MRINSIDFTMPQSNSALKLRRSASVPVNKLSSVSFGNKIQPRNKEQVIFIGAESDPWSKGGGVGTVMKDYRSFDKPENQIEITPYYKGYINEANKTVEPAKDAESEYIMHTNTGDVKIR